MYATFYYGYQAYHLKKRSWWVHTALIAFGGLFFLLGFIGNVDYCTEMGIECEVGFPHLLGSALLMIFGFAGYKVTTYLQRGTFNRYD